MSQPYFSQPAELEALAVALKKWENTPFVAHCERPGAGVDCIRFAAAVLAGIGAIEPVDWPPYAINGNRAHGYLHILRGIHERGLVLLPADAPHLPGDLHIYTDRHFLHTGLIGPDGQLWHCLRGPGVVPHDPRDPTFAKRLRRRYRLYIAQQA